mmetsp:Transcript_58903/g.127938  ORF Transcript_58903/g.127938 Transcript_58903/m.127938 type:complete len:200 (+) Transcript_58903:288-887(+)
MQFYFVRSRSAVAADVVRAALFGGLGAAEAASLFEVLLVVLFGRPENLRHFDLSHNRTPVLLLLLCDCLLRHLHLLIRMGVNPVPVLRASVISDLVEQSCVHRLQQGLAESSILALLRIEDNLNAFGVARRATAHLVVRWLLDVSLRVPDACRNHARNALEMQFRAPKAAASEGGNLPTILGLDRDFALQGVFCSFAPE